MHWGKNLYQRHTQLTKTEENCVGFTPIGEDAMNLENRFEGKFDGRNNEIRNI